MLGAIQIVDGYVVIENANEPALDNMFVLDEANKFDFGKKENVIIIVLDAFQGSVFKEILDANPQYAKKFDGFTWFQNASISIPSTQLSLPNMLSGIPYDNTVPVQEYKRRTLLSHSIPSVFRGAGYQSEYYSSFSYGILPIDERLWTNAKRKTNLQGLMDEYNKLVQVTNFRLSPQVVKKVYTQMAYG